MFDNLKSKIEELTNNIAQVEENEDFDDFSLRAMRQTMEDLINFDLEDWIANAE